MKIETITAYSGYLTPILQKDYIGKIIEKEDLNVGKISAIYNTKGKIVKKDLGNKIDIRV